MKSRCVMPGVQIASRIKAYPMIRSERVRALDVLSCRRTKLGICAPRIGLHSVLLSKAHMLTVKPSPQARKRLSNSQLKCSERPRTQLLRFLFFFAASADG